MLGKHSTPELISSALFVTNFWLGCPSWPGTREEALLLQPFLVAVSPLVAAWVVPIPFNHYYKRGFRYFLTLLLN